MCAASIDTLGATTTTTYPPCNLPDTILCHCGTSCYSAITSAATAWTSKHTQPQSAYLPKCSRLPAWTVPQVAHTHTHTQAHPTTPKHTPVGRYIVVYVYCTGFGGFWQDPSQLNLLKEHSDRILIQNFSLFSFFYV